MGFQLVESLHLYFFFFIWCLGFCIWFNCINLWWWVFNPWWWSLHLWFFYFFILCLGFRIWFDLLKPVVMGFQPVVNLFASLFLFFLFFFFVWCLDFRIWFVPFWCLWWWVFILWWWSLHLLHLGFQTHVNLQNQATKVSNRTIPTSNHISLVYLSLPMSIIVFFKTFVKLI